MISTAIILAGGLGTRLYPLTESTPKPLLPLKGKPILGHIISNLCQHGIKNIILCIGYKAEQIKEYFKDGSKWGVHLHYCIESEPLGTGGALREASKHLQGPFLAFNGDNVANFNIAELIRTHQQNKTKITLTLFPVEDVTKYGIAKLEGHQIKQFVEKPSREEAPSNLNNAGAYVLEPAALDILSEGKSSIERDCFEKLAPLGEVGAYIHPGQWFPTDTLEKYSEACHNFIPSIDFQEKKVIIADVDETICPTCQQIQPAMAEQINSMIRKGYQFAFISGTKAEHLFEMISSLVIEPHHILATTGTKYVLVQKDGKKEVKYSYAFTSEEKEEIIAALEKLLAHFDIKPLTSKEDQVQERESQITLSALGRYAPLDLKAKFDPEGEKRKVWISFLKNIFNKDKNQEKYEIHLGGTTSLDITKKGMDKEWGIKQFAQYHKIPLGDILFFGDKIYPGGNDYAASRIVDCVAVRNPEHTLEELRKIEQLTVVYQNTGKNTSGKLDLRPWGKFEQFTYNEPSTVKIIQVEAGKRLSLQSHQQREELWIALDDGVITEIDNQTKVLQAGEKVLVPKGAKHRLAANSKDARVLEISFGKFDENDIIRYEDDFGRA